MSVQSVTNTAAFLVNKQNNSWYPQQIMLPPPGPHHSTHKHTCVCVCVLHPPFSDRTIVNHMTDRLHWQTNLGIVSFMKTLHVHVKALFMFITFLFFLNCLLNIFLQPLILWQWLEASYFYNSFFYLLLLLMYIFFCYYAVLRICTEWNIVLCI